MTHKEIVEKLIGRIDPAGASHIDVERKQNLIDMCNLVEGLVHEIGFVATYRDRVEWSMQDMGNYAHDFLTSIQESIAH